MLVALLALWLNQVKHTSCFRGLWLLIKMSRSIHAQDLAVDLNHFICPVGTQSRWFRLYLIAVVKLILYFLKQIMVFLIKSLHLGTKHGLSTTTPLLYLLQNFDQVRFELLVFEQVSLSDMW